METLYPEYQWQGWHFPHVPAHYWDRLENVKEFFEFVKRKVGITHFSEWFDLSNEHLRLLGAGKELRTNNKWKSLLERVYPEEYRQYYPPHHSQLKTNSSLSKSQILLTKVIKQLFPEREDIHINYKHPTVNHPNSNQPIEFDIYIPSLNLAIEYQGEHHYKPDFRNTELFQLQQQRDQSKRKVSILYAFYHLSVYYLILLDVMLNEYIYI